MRVLIALSVVTLVLVLRTLFMVQTLRPAPLEGMLEQQQPPVECPERSVDANPWSANLD